MFLTEPLRPGLGVGRRLAPVVRPAALGVRQHVIGGADTLELVARSGLATLVRHLLHRKGLVCAGAFWQDGGGRASRASREGTR